MGEHPPRAGGNDGRPHITLGMVFALLLAAALAIFVASERRRMNRSIPLLRSVDETDLKSEVLCLACGAKYRTLT